MVDLKMRWLASAAMVAFLVGCEPTGPKVYPVKGTVSYQGKPMAGGGSISFVPTGGQQGVAPAGMIKPDGTYELGSHKLNDGAMAGEYRVVITQETVKEPANSEDGQAAATETVTVAETDIIPAIYSDSAKSPLTKSVEEKPNEINIDLQPQ